MDQQRKDTHVSKSENWKKREDNYEDKRTSNTTQTYKCRGLAPGPHSQSILKTSRLSNSS